MARTGRRGLAGRPATAPLRARPLIPAPAPAPSPGSGPGAVPASGPAFAVAAAAVPPTASDPAADLSSVPVPMPALLADFRALADETRLRIIRLLLEYGAFHVNEIAAVLELSQPRISRHLRILADARLIRAVRRGAHVVYTATVSDEELRSGTVRPALFGILRRAAGDPGFFGEDRQRALAWLVDRDRQRRLEYDRIGPRWYSVRDRFLGALDEATLIDRQIGTARVVVDLGAGDGRLLCALPPGRDYIGVDGSTAMVAAARERARQQQRPEVQFRLGDLEHLPLPDSCADAVIACMVLHHLDHLPPVLAEIRRALRPRGRLIVLDFLAVHSGAGSPAGPTGFDRRRLVAQIRAAGLRPTAWRLLRAGLPRPLFLATAVRAAGRATQSSQHQEEE